MSAFFYKRDTGDDSRSLSLNALRFWYFGAVVALFLFLAVTYLLRPIMEPDFFWHLKTGEWIWEHGQLPTTDQFSFVVPNAADARQLTILRGYWLAQITYHAVISIFGIWGVFILRALVLGAFFILFTGVFERHQINRLLAISLLAIFSIFFLENYALERPQVFSFLAIGPLLILYRWLRDTHIPMRSHLIALITVFLLLSIWANSHGGALLGQCILLVIGVVELFCFVAKRNRERFKHMSMFLLVGFLGSMTAPSMLGFSEILSLVGAGDKSFAFNISQINYEYYSVYTWLFIYKNYKLCLPIVLSILTLLLLKEALKKGNYTEIVLLFVFWFFGYRHIRYLPVAMVFSILFISWNYYPKCFINYAVVPFLAIAITSFFMWTSNDIGHISKARTQGLIDGNMFPVAAADFLLKNEYKGRLFNTINWGGYLIWRLSPGIKVLSDGRVLNPIAYSEVNRASKGERGISGGPLWKDIVNRYGIDIALTPVMNGPRISSLTQSFARDSGWQEVYRDRVAVVFVRRMPILSSGMN